MNIITLSTIDAAVNAAFESAQAKFDPTPAGAASIKRLRVASKEIGAGCALCTDVYNGPRGTGFQVGAAVTIGSKRFVCVRNHGPETWRERDWDRKGMKQALDEKYSSRIEAGIEAGGVTLAATEADRAKFSQLMTLLREAEELRATEDQKTEFLDSTVTIADIHGTVHNVSVRQARSIVVDYGMQVNAIWAEWAQAKAGILQGIQGA